MRARIGTWKTWDWLSRLAAVLLGAVTIFTAAVVVLIVGHVGQ